MPNIWWLLLSTTLTVKSTQPLTGKAGCFVVVPSTTKSAKKTKTRWLFMVAMLCRARSISQCSRAKWNLPLSTAWATTWSRSEITSLTMAWWNLPTTTTSWKLQSFRPTTISAPPQWRVWCHIWLRHLAESVWALSVSTWIHEVWCRRAITMVSTIRMANSLPTQPQNIWRKCKKWIMWWWCRISAILQKFLVNPATLVWWPRATTSISWWAVIPIL